jgi:hypothetical protein
MEGLVPAECMTQDSEGDAGRRLSTLERRRVPDFRRAADNAPQSTSPFGRHFYLAREWSPGIEYGVGSLARKEGRSLSNMMVKLLGEALDARRLAVSASPDEVRKLFSILSAPSTK